MTKYAAYTQEQLKAVTDYMEDQFSWTYSREITAATGVRGIHIRGINASTGMMIASPLGYKHIREASMEEINKYIKSLECRREALAVHIENVGLMVQARALGID